MSRRNQPAPWDGRREVSGLAFQQGRDESEDDCVTAGLCQQILSESLAAGGAATNTLKRSATDRPPVWKCPDHDTVDTAVEPRPATSQCL